MLEFKMQTNLQTDLPATINFNFEELKTELATRLEHYNNLVVTEDTVKEGKEDRAKLNKLKTAIETRRKEIKKQWAQPYTEFEAKVKELTALIDQPIAAIDSQVKSYEEAAKAKKQQSIQEFYNENVAPELQAIMPLEKIWQSDWLNSTKSLKKVQLEIIERAAKTTADLDFLDSMEADDYTAAVRAKYMETLNITTALSLRSELQQAAEAFKARQAEQPDPQPKTAPETTREPEKAPAVASEQTEKLYALKLELHLTQKQASELKKFLSDNNIRYTKI